jgi:perosamine synthetase
MNIASYKPTITRKELESVLDCLINDEFSKSAVKNFESSLSTFIGVKYALATNSVTAAYHLAFTSLGISQGDEVIIPSYFEGSPLNALNLTGGTAVLVDTEEGSLVPSLPQIKEKITSRTKAVVIGHLFGIPVNIIPFKELSLPIIEDISHALGVNAEGDAGKQGTITVVSFTPAMMITTGNGGMVLTDNSRMYATMRDFRGTRPGAISYDYCMTDFQGALGTSQLSKLQSFVKRRREIARIYFDALKFTSHSSPFRYNDSYAYQSFPILFDAPKTEVEKYWKKNRIGVYHPISEPLHHYLSHDTMKYPNSSRLARKLYSLPIYPRLSKREIERIAKLLAQFI